MKVMNMVGGQALGLRLALLFYGPEHLLNRDCEAGQAFASMHQVQAGEIGAGVCLDEATMAHLVRLISGQTGECKVLPKNILHASGDRMLWYASARRSTIWFNSGRPSLDSLSGKTVPYPPLVFLARPGRLSVWALRKDVRPEEDTALYRAPFFNIYANGKMCEGNIALPKSLSPADIPIWEKAFYSTEFTFSNYGKLPVCSHKGGHDGLWRELSAPKMSSFPGGVLVPIVDETDGNKPLTIQEALNQ